MSHKLLRDVSLFNSKWTLVVQVEAIGYYLHCIERCDVTVDDDFRSKYDNTVNLCIFPVIFFASPLPIPITTNREVIPRTVLYVHVIEVSS